MPSSHVSRWRALSRQDRPRQVGAISRHFDTLAAHRLAHEACDPLAPQSQLAPRAAEAAHDRETAEHFSANIKARGDRDALQQETTMKPLFSPHLPLWRSQRRPPPRPSSTPSRCTACGNLEFGKNGCRCRLHTRRHAGGPMRGHCLHADPGIHHSGASLRAASPGSGVIGIAPLEHGSGRRRVRADRPRNDESAGCSGWRRRGRPRRDPPLEVAHSRPKASSSAIETQPPCRECCTARHVPETLRARLFLAATRS